MGIPPQRLRQVVGTDLPVGAALRAQIRQRRGGILVVGGVERTGWRLLERNAGGVSKAVRLRGGRAKARASGRSRRRTGHDWSGESESRGVSAELSRACAARQEL